MSNEHLTTLFTGRNLILLDQTDSTNNYAGDCLRSSIIPEGTAILTHNQMHGRGQSDAQWLSEPHKNLTFSLILYPKFLKPENQFLLNQVVSTGLIDALETFTNQAFSIKWPNDILYKKQKIAGLLIENSLYGKVLKSSVIGIGLNVNQEEFDGLPHATSLLSVLNKQTPLMLIFDLICNSVEKKYLALKNNQTEKLKLDYLNKMAFLNSREAYQISGEQVFAVARGVNSEGKLMLEFDNGLVQYFYPREAIKVM